MSTVCNVKSEESQEVLFFGPDLGLVSYLTPAHPPLERLETDQTGFFWMPTEVQLANDIVDFGKLPENLKHIFTSNIKRQILLDSIQGRGPALAFLPICSSQNLESFTDAWSYFENNIHAKSYKHILKNLYPDPQKIIDEAKDIPEIVACSNDISRYYDNLIYHNALREVVSRNLPIAYSLYSHKKALWMALHAVNALEGIRFYVSFACSWAFADSLKIMKGNATIIKFICMSNDHEILTTEGWKFFKDLDKSEKVAQYHEDGSITFVNPIRHIEEDYDGDMIRYSGTGYFDAMYTPEHRVIYKENKELREATAYEFNPSCRKSFIGSGKAKSGKSKISYMDKFRIAVQADGHISNRYTGEISGHLPVVFTLSKKRKIERLSKILSKINFDYTSDTHKISKAKIFTVKVPLHYNITKDFSWVKINKFNYKGARSFLKEISRWDGSQPNRIDKEGTEDFSRILYSTSDSSCADVVQAIAALSGWRQYRSKTEDTRKETYKDIHRIFILSKTAEYNCGNKRKTKSVEHYQGKVYCVTVPSGMIVVRRNGKVVITGNCRDENLHLAATQYIIKKLLKEDPDFVKIKEDCKQDVENLFRDVIEQEKAWAKFLFKDGPMLGLTETILCQYVDFIAQNRMRDLGLPAFTKIVSNPLPWTVKWIHGDNIQTANQEVENNTYKAGDIDMSIEPGDLTDIVL